MEIRSYTPSSQSFGMAFRKPKADNVEHFSKWLMGKKESKHVERSLEKFIKGQADNKHFDIEYVYDANKSPRDVVRLIPVSEDAKRLHNIRVYTDGYRNEYAKVAEQVAWEVQNCPLEYRSIVQLKGLFKKAFAYIKYCVNSESALPQILVKAGRRAGELEKAVDVQVANEASVNRVFK